MTSQPASSRLRLSRQTILIALVILAGILLAVLILTLSPRAAAPGGHGAAAAPAGDADHAHEEDHAQEISLSAEQVRQGGIRLAAAGPAQIAHTLQLPGEIRLNQDRSVQIVPRLEGMVESASVSAGQPVRKGQVLAVLSSPALAEHRSALMAAQQRLSLAQGTYLREKSLWQEGISAQQDYLQARAEREEARIAVLTAEHRLAALGSPAGNRRDAASLGRYEMRAPIAGVVTEKRLTAGQVVQADAPVLAVADLSTVWVEMVVRAGDLGAVRVGQPASVQASAFDAAGSGRLSYISPLVGEQTRTAVARLELPNPEGQWRPGLPVNVALTTATDEVPVAVATTALQTVDEKPVVFVRTEDGFAARPVTPGRSDSRWTEIRQGLQAGETYVAGNSFLLKAELGKADASHDH